jgi:tetraprenyl-beta-curcumene synthase
MDMSVIPDKPRLLLANNWKIRTRKSCILFHYIFRTLPIVKKSLKYWEVEAHQIVNPELKIQALSSLDNKAFHCQGGAVFAVPYRKWETLLVELIVAYQTLCDYLDNLCDRANCTNGIAFIQLHQALIDALTPEKKPLNDYYRKYPFRDDALYIDKLVLHCQKCVSQLPSYDIVYKDIIILVDLYSKLQVYKHISWDNREKELKDWADSLLPGWPDILWQEFAAASGSTLAVFALMGLATCPGASKIDSQAIIQTYFPWICGLHILLDYFIDREEDKKGGDLNFTFYYPDTETMMGRLIMFINKAHQNASILPDPGFTETVIEGLLAMYLSDKKVYQQGFKKLAQQLIKESGGGTINTVRLCSLVRNIQNWR